MRPIYIPVGCRSRYMKENLVFEKLVLSFPVPELSSNFSPLSHLTVTKRGVDLVHITTLYLLRQIHRFCDSKIRNNTVLQCKTFSHFDILVVYLILLIFSCVSIYVCVFLCPWPHHLNIFSFNWLPGIFNF